MTMHRFMYILLFFAITIIHTNGAEFTALPVNGKSIVVLKDGGEYLTFGFGGWGKNWGWMGFGKSNVSEKDGATVLHTSDIIRAGKAKVDFQSLVRASEGRKLTFEMELSSDKDADITLMMMGITAAPGSFSGGKMVVRGSAEKKEYAYPFNKDVNVAKAQGFELIDGTGQKTTIAFSPQIKVLSDRALRVILAEKSLKSAQPVKVTMTVELPEKITYYPSLDKVPQESGAEQWYTFKPNSEHDKPSVIGMQDWLEKPAGKHGRIRTDGEKLVYNEKPIKLWGINVCYSSCAPKKELAEKRAAFYAKYGINSVRLHKYADGTGWAGIQSTNSFVEFDKDALDRMDYFVAQLKKRGIYVKLSSTFTVKLGTADEKYVPYINEFGKFKKRKGDRLQTKHGSIFMSSELQNLQIAQVVNLLKHKNPYTGLTYAEEPSVAVVEMFNEDDALFGGMMAQMKKPTLRKRIGLLFTQWLRKKYGTEEALKKAWGDKALNSFTYEKLTGESWADNTILPIGNPWYFAKEQMEGLQKFRKQRLLDTMVFMYDLQNTFYARYSKAIRDAGYTGMLLASNWQAGSGISHYLNLSTDAQFDIIDRHNYFGGGGGGQINNASMLSVPGSGIFSAGMQQVGNKPFMLSEWIHVNPTEWGVEGPAIIGAYGMGLQGWDVSYMFQNRDAGEINTGFKDKWQVDKPTIIGVFPAIARQVLRGDVKESELVFSRYVNIDVLEKGKVGFEDQTVQQHDTKSFDSDKVPGKALAIGRCVVDFTSEYKDTPAVDLSSYANNNRFTSSTKQLQWQQGDSSTEGYFTMNTPATKAVVGFAKGKSFKLVEVDIDFSSRYGALYITATEPNADIVSSKKLLVTAIGRCRNTGMKVFADRYVLEGGKPPLVMEPIVATIHLHKTGMPTVYALDHNGVRTKKTIPVVNGVLQIDTGRDQTPYYEIAYE